MAASENGDGAAMGEVMVLELPIMGAADAYCSTSGPWIMLLTSPPFPDAIAMV